MSKKILFMSSAKLSAICTVLLLAVFCTIGMSFRPVYSEDEAEIVMHGPRRDHTSSSSCSGSTYSNDVDYGQTKAVTNGNGTVCASTSSSSKTGYDSGKGESEPIQGSFSSITWNCGLTGSSNHTSDWSTYHTKTHYVWATPNDGYYFLQWNIDKPTASTSTSQMTAVTYTIPNESKYETSPGYVVTATATFSPVTVDAVSASPKSQTFEPTNAKKDCNDYTGTIIFDVTGADAMADFTGSTVSVSKTGDALCEITSGPTLSNGQVSIDYRIYGNDKYGSRNNTFTFSLESKATDADPRSQSCVITANFPNVELDGSDVEVNSSTVAGDVSGSFVVGTMYVDGTEDFTSIPSAFSSISGPSGTWELNSCTFDGTDFATGEGSFTVNYTFKPNGTAGTTTAEFTLTAKEGVGGASKTISLTANIEAPATNDASVQIGTEEPVEYEHIADAIAAANEVAYNQPAPVVKLLREVTVTEPLVLSRTMTFDLNAHVLTGNLSETGTNVFSVESQNAIVTLCSSRQGGKIVASGNYAGRLSAIEVNKGKLVLQSGEIELSNSDNGAAADKLYACGVYLSMSPHDSYDRPTSAMQMTGGSITVNRPNGGAYAYGVYCDGAGKNSSAADLRNASIATTVTGGAHAYGALLAGESPVNNMTITANAATDAYGIWVNDGATVVVENGQYIANASSSQACAVNSCGTLRIQSGAYIANRSLTDDLSDVTGSNAIAVNVTAGTAVINDGTFTASATTGAYALQLTANSGNPSANVAFGVFSAQAKANTAAGAKLNANTSLTTTGGSFSAKTLANATDAVAYGVMVVDGASANIGNTSLYATAHNTNSTSSNPDSGAFGLRNEGSAIVNASSINATSAKGWAYGIYTKKNISISNSTTVADATERRANALYVNGASAVAAVTGSTFTAKNAAQYAYGAYVMSGTLNTSECTFQTDETGATVRGVFLGTAGVASLSNCSVSATGTSDACALYNTGDMSVASTTAIGTHYGIYVKSNSTKTIITSGNFKGDTNAYGQDASCGTKNVFSGGYYSSNSNLASYVKTGYQVFTLPTGTAEYEAGYRYSIGTPDAPGYSVCKIVNSNGTTLSEYLTLNEAIQAVAANQTIVMTADYTLPAGNYELPANTTLLVPFKDGTGAGATSAIGDGSKNNCTNGYTQPSVFRKLTFADGVNFTLKGVFEMSAFIHADGQWADEGGTTGKYGQLVMNEGAHMDIESGGKLYSWGFITGTGVINAKKGATITEPFQMADWPGGTNATLRSGYGYDGGMMNHTAFMITHYFYQNIECNIYYRPGSNALGSSAAIISSSTYYVPNVKLVGQTGENAMFLMDANDTNPDSWVHRKYNPTTDINEWTVNSGANLGGITITVNGRTINSADHDLPITSNMHIKLNYGDMQITQNVNFLPGSKLEILKEGRVFIKGVKVGFFNFSDYGGRYYGARYSPTWGTTNPRGSLSSAVLTLKNDYKKDAEMFVHGVFDIVSGSLYTSPSGSNIHSTNGDAGLILYSSAAPQDGQIYYVGGTDHNKGNETASVVAAKLQNADDSYSDTKGTSAGDLWGYKNNKWIKMKGGDCLYEEYAEDGTTLTDVMNAYPSSFVEVAPNDPDDHAYHTTADVSKYVIYVDASTTSAKPICTWWDAVPKEDGHYMITNEKSDLDGAYYYFDETVSYWKPRTYKINWYNNTSFLIYNNVARNAKPKFVGKGYNNNNQLTNGATVTVPTEAGYNFYWDGWVTDNADRLNQDCRVYSNDDMPRATDATTYYAHFRKEKKTYTITFVASDGKTTIERPTVEHGVMPVCTASPSKGSTIEEDYTLYWTVSGTETKYLPENLPVATGAVTYVATFVATPRLYTITFANYNGDVLKQGNVAYGTSPVAPSVPTRQNDGFYSYDFTGWKAGKVFVDKDDVLPTVSGTTTYTAQFSTTDWTPEYTITFQDEDGTPIQTQHIRLGNSLTDPTETLLASGKLQKAEDAGYTYVFDSWSPALVEQPTEDATYTAVYRIATTKQYTITFKDEDNFTLQSGKVDYGTEPAYTGETPTKASDAEWVYTFDSWSPAIESVTGDATYTATYSKTKRKYTILFKNGETTFTNSVAPDNKWEYGVTPYIEGVTPTKEPAGGYYFAFDGWTPVATPVTNDMTYYAHFSQTLERHKITWMPEDGTGDPLRVDENVPYGSIPTYGGETPTKDGDDQYSYVYDGWSSSANGNRLTPPLPALTGDAIFYAHFAQTTRTYMVTWLNEDGTTLETDEKVEYGATPHYDGATPTKAGNEENVYSFNGWNNKPATVTGDVTITATYSSATTVASVTAGGNTVYFSSMDAAFADAGTKRDATIKLFKDYDGSLTYATSLTNNTCVLDMNSKSISAQVTINNGSAGFTISNGTIENNSGTAIIVNAGKLIIANNTIINGHSSAIRLETGSVLEMNGGTVRSNAASDISALYMNSGSEATIYGGIINVTATGNKAHAIYVDGGEVTLANGVINANANQEAYGIYVNSGSATVNGGLITATSNTTGAFDVYLTASGNGVITGGKFKASGMSDVFGVNGIAAANKFDISGGFYQQNDNLSKYAKSPYGLRELDEDDVEYAEGYRHAVSSTFDITIDDEQPLEVSTSASTTTVTTTGSLDINTGVTLNTVKLYIESEPENDQSGELNGNVEMPDNGKAYFDLILDDTEPRHWHAFSVPFQVNLKKSGTPLIVNGEKLTLGRGYDIVYYDGAERAKHGKSAACWKYVEDPVAVGGGDSILYPGRAYMIASGSRALNRIRFTKATGAALMNNTVDVSANISETSDDKDGGWNGIGNPKLSHAVLDAGVALCQVHDGGKIGEDGYMPYVLEEKKLVVGRAVFVQVGENPSVVVKSANGMGEIVQYVNPAPRRASAKNKEDRYEVMIASSNGTMADRLFILADEEKEDKYVILEDVAKAGISPVRAQMWVDRYGEKLCMNTTALINGKANYPLTIAAPKAGEYEIFLNGQAKEGTTLYLTYDGKAIWNLTYGGYTAALEKGTNTHYGLRVVINKVATEIEQTTIENGDAVRKVIVNDKVYIIRNGEIYSITGQKAQ